MKNVKKQSNELNSKQKRFYKTFIDRDEWFWIKNKIVMQHKQLLPFKNNIQALEYKIQMHDELLIAFLGTNYEFQYKEDYIDALMEYIDAKLQISKS